MFPKMNERGLFGDYCSLKIEKLLTAENAEYAEIKQPIAFPKLKQLTFFSANSAISAL
jgi:hypothetical protein